MKPVIDTDFIRDLTKAIIENCCDESATACKVRNDRLEGLSIVLQRYIDNQRPLELQCIQAIHHFAHEKEYPPGKSS